MHAQILPPLVVQMGMRFQNMLASAVCRNLVVIRNKMLLDTNIYYSDSLPEGRKTNKLHVSSQRIYKQHLMQNMKPHLWSAKRLKSCLKVRRIVSYAERNFSLPTRVQQWKQPLERPKKVTISRGAKWNLSTKDDKLKTRIILNPRIRTDMREPISDPRQQCD